MLTLNEAFAVPDAVRSWTMINDLNTLVPCVPGASVKATGRAPSGRSPTSAAKAAGMGEDVIVNVLTDLVRSFSVNVVGA